MSPRHFPHRPPWWPREEPWPPPRDARRAGWQRMRGRFFWRMGALFALFYFFSVAACTLLFWLVASLIGWSTVPPSAQVFAQAGIFAVVVIGVSGFTFALRGFRRMAVPIGDVMEAAQRVANGDYAARVEEHGPREVRALARAFNEMTARLQMNDEQRRNLLADVTHELRTPLTVIQGNLEGLLDGVYPRDDTHLGAILEETRLLSRLVDDLRTLALTEAGALQLEREATDLGALVNEVVASFRAQADENQVQLSAQVDSNLPRIEIDPTRIRQVMENLIANALRYTPQGGQIRVTGTQNQEAVAVVISDTGAGIPTEQLPHIFDRFYKSRDSGGSGLGLAIAKNLVAAHGGNISATSEMGKGTVIRFTLPIAN